ncbi:hypothetical protein KAR34_05800 [bacterium]|nr:hypothetical protein [bacterium]
MKVPVRIIVALFVLMVAAAPPIAAKVRINSITISPRVLMEIYKAWDKGDSKVEMVSSKILMMSVESTKAKNSFRFRLEIKDGNVDVASVNFMTTVPLVVGKNVFNAGQISNPANNVINYNNDYLKQEEVMKMLQGGNSQIKGNFQVQVIPLDPTGPSYAMRIAMFAPPSAQNNPPRVIYPNSIVVNTLLPMFSWSPGQGAVSYEVLVSPNQDPTINTYWKSPMVRANQLLYLPSARALENGKKYYWMVMAYDEFGKSIGGLNGRSQPAWFKLNSVGKVNTAVTPVEADAAMRVAIKQKDVFDELKNYKPVALESTSSDLADLLRQLREGSAHVTAFDLE